ncbi:COG3740 Phage head maturation protease [uncultured Caudovirales phage]|uniref:COG3740 Phage head maturation protease n=1 Tax=uncultured Caudovirales phage TaxID=2100421 RepID=A0A6J5N580_9CAUD|nr:COG3740 Phage head maturation protease [uncultured Caudovirales phage]
MHDKEQRILNCEPIELRAAVDSTAQILRGYAAKFNVLSQDLGGFREMIAPGAFDAVISNDVRALLNHDPNHVLGRTLSGTARIGIDATGLWYEVTLPDTQTGRDLAESIKRGDITQSSFAFSIAPGGDSWAADETGAVLRTISKMGALYDVSPVTYPAYPDATIGMRTAAEFKEKSEQRKRADHEAARIRVANKRKHVTLFEKN